MQIPHIAVCVDKTHTHSVRERGFGLMEQWLCVALVSVVAAVLGCEVAGPMSQCRRLDY